MSEPTLYDLLVRRGSSNRVALGTADRSVTLSYRDLELHAREFAEQLRRLGVRECDTVAITADNCVEFVVALFGVASVGAIAAPISVHLAGPELAKSLATVHAKALVVAEGGVPVATLCSPAPRARVEPAKDVALVMLTGGTTAAPKAVPLTHANLAASVFGICATYELAADDATLLVMPLTHGHGLIAGLLSTLASGGSAYLPSARRFSAHTFWPEMMAAGATWYTAVPTMHQILTARAATEYPKERAPLLRFIRTCSAPIAPRAFDAVESAFHAPLISAYGMTETTHQTTSNPLPARGPRKGGSVGVPTGVELRLSSTGEVLVRGPTVTSGYVDDSSANEAAFDDGWFCTGDIGEVDADGYLFLKGRIKELINRGGEKIFPTQVDAVLMSDPKVLEAATFGVPDAKYGEEIHAAVVLRPGQTATSAELQDYCARSLGAFEIPKTFRFVSELPRTEKGAIDRRRLAASFR